MFPIMGIKLIRIAPKDLLISQSRLLFIAKPGIIEINEYPDAK